MPDPSLADHKQPVPKRTKFGPYVLIRTVGEGQFGKVKLSVDTRTQREVAIKFLKKERVRDINDRNKVLREINLLQALDHPYIVSLLEVVETNAYIGLVLEYAPGGELFHYIMAQPSGHLSETEGRKFFAQLVSGVSYMHFMGIVHRDLKLENLLLGPENNILISDLGFANTSSEHMATQCGSPSYAAPELVSNNDYVGVSVDIWSCGVILYGMLCGYLPYDDDPSNPDSENIQRLYQYIRTTTLTYPPFVAGLARQLMSIMLVPDPKNRAKMSEVMGHSWLAPESHIFTEELQRRLKQVGFSSSETLTDSKDMVNTQISASVASSAPDVKSEVVSVSMSRSNSVSSKAMNWFWGNRGSSSGNPVITPIHPNGKFNTFGLSLGGTSGGGLEMERTTSTATDSAPERQSMSYSITASDLEDGAIRERRLNFCSGPIDKRALSTRDPLELLVDIESLLVQRYNWTIQSNGASSGEFKLKVVKPRGIKIQEVNLVSSERVAMDIKSDVKREVASDPKMAQIYSGFPVSLKAKITKFMSSLAPSANKGFDGKESLASTTEALSGMEDEICFTVEIKKVKELASGTLMVDFRRLKGDVWGFKRLYSSVITELPL